jgi:hypothetical protein
MGIEFNGEKLIFHHLILIPNSFGPPEKVVRAESGYGVLFLPSVSSTTCRSCGD